MAVMQLLAFCLMVSSSDAQQFRTVKAADPADALADTMLKKSGFDSEEKNSRRVVLPTHSWNAVPFHEESVASGPSHNRLSSKDLIGFKPMVRSGSLSTPKEWSSASAAKPDGLSSIKDGMQHMFNDLRSAHTSNVADRSEFQAESVGSMKESTEVVKVLQADTVIHQPVHKTAARDVAPDDESSLPAYMNQLDHGPSAGLRWFREPLLARAMHDKTSAKAARKATDVQVMNATELENKAEQIKEEVLPESADSLANSLASEMLTSKKPPMQRAHLPTGEVKMQEVHAAGEVEKEEVPQPSPLDSVHRGKRAKEMLPIRPEDVHHEVAAAPEPEEIKEAQPLIKLPAQKIQAQAIQGAKPIDQEPSDQEGSSQKDLFTMHAVDGHVDSKGMEAVLEAMGTKADWNWHRFDLDGDGKLSHAEFSNAEIVAQRFKKH